MVDRIHIEELVLMTRIGVPDEERQQLQRLTANITLMPASDFRGLEDDIEKTVDYADVVLAVERVAQERPRKLVETLAEDIAAALLRRYPLAEVAVELRKYILPNTAYVSVAIRRP